MYATILRTAFPLTGSKSQTRVVSRIPEIQYFFFKSVVRLGGKKIKNH